MRIVTMTLFLLAHPAAAQSALPSPAGASTPEQSSDSGDARAPTGASMDGAAGKPADDNDATTNEADEDTPVSAPSDAEPDAASAPPTIDGVSNAVATSSPETPEKLVALLDLTHSEGLKPLSTAVTTVLAAEVASRQGLKAVSRDELRALLTHASDAQMLGCDSVRCAVDIAKLVEADYVVAGSVERITDSHVIGLSLIDPAAGAVVQRSEMRWRSGPDGLLELVRPLADRLFDGAAAVDYVGSLDVVVPDGAVIYLDGKPSGTAPLKAPLSKLPIGPHRIAIELAGHRSIEDDVAIRKNETTVYRADLEAMPLYTQWWFWTAIGGSAAVTAVAITAVGVGTAAILAPPPTTTVHVGNTVQGVTP